MFFRRGGLKWYLRDLEGRELYVFKKAKRTGFCMWQTQGLMRVSGVPETKLCLVNV